MVHSGAAASEMMAFADHDGAPGVRLKLTAIL